MLIDEAKFIAYNQSKRTRLFIEAAYRKINTNLIKTYIISLQYDDLILLCALYYSIATLVNIYD